MSVGRTVYTFAFRILIPFFLFRIAWRGFKSPGYWRHWPERFGFGVYPKTPAKLVWLHGVSVGEVLAAKPLVDQMRQHRPGWGWLITVTTPTGRDRAQALYGEFATVRYLPYDLPGAMKRFLIGANPCLAVIMETEFWPNLFAQSAQRGIPLALVNVRMSEKSAAGYARFSSLTKELLSHVKWAAVQTDDDCRRLLALGLPSERSTVTGTIKLDARISTSTVALGKALREELGSSRPLWIAASTRHGEEEIILEAHQYVIRTLPSVGLLLVPRHPERFNEVADLITRRGFELIRRTNGASPGKHWQVYLGDTMGELSVFYAASDLAFVGGSLVPLGGQNIMEPAALGLPVVSGPHTFNFAQIASDLESAGGLTRVNDAAELAQVVVRLLQFDNERVAQGSRAQAYVTANRGAAEWVAGQLAAMVPSEN